MSTVAELITPSQSKKRCKQRYMHGWLYTGEIDVSPETGPNSVEKTLELRITQVDVDKEDIDILTRLSLPLTILLVEKVREPSGQTHGYEDVYYYATDGTFMRHGWKKFRYTNGRCDYEPNKYQYDGDPKKLFAFGDSIKELLTRVPLHHSLEENPTVQGLKTATLWKHY
jgi:hypothetical protein